MDPHSSLSVPLTLPAWTTQTSSREIGAGEIRTDAALWSSIHSWSPVPREGLVPGEHSAHCFLNQRVETEVHSKGALSSARQAASSSRFSILTTRRGQEQYAHIQAAPRRRLGHRWQGGQGWGRGATDDLRGHWKLKPLCNQDRTRRAVLQVSSCFLVATDLHYLSRRLLGAPTPRANCCWQSAAHAPSAASPQPMGVRRAALPSPAGRLPLAPPWCCTCCAPSSCLGSRPSAGCAASRMQSFKANFQQDYDLSFCFIHNVLSR